MDVEALADRIEEDIVFGAYAPGARLVEERMTRALDTSRHQLRAAFAMLEARGTIRRFPNRGVEVSEPSPDEIDELYEVRRILETSAARLTPLPVAPATLERLRHVQDGHEEAVRREDHRGVFHANIAFHALQYSTCPNGALTAAIADYARRVHVIRAIKYDDAAHMATVIAQHRAILDAMAGSDAEAYAARVAEHLPASTEAYRKAYERRHGTACDRRHGTAAARVA